MESLKSHLRKRVYSAHYFALPSRFRWQAQLDAWFSPTLLDEISDIPFSLDQSGQVWIILDQSTSLDKVTTARLLLNVMHIIWRRRRRRKRKVKMTECE